MTLMTNPPTAPKRKYKGDRKPITVVLSEGLVTLAKDYFPETNHRSLSRFMESALRSEFRKRAPRIRRLGKKIPESVFSK